MKWAILAVLVAVVTFVGAGSPPVGVGVAPVDVGTLANRVVVVEQRLDALEEFVVSEDQPTTAPAGGPAIAPAEMRARTDAERARRTAAYRERLQLKNAQRKTELEIKKEKVILHKMKDD